MEERLINKRIKEVMDEYPFKKPPCTLFAKLQAL